MAALPTVLTALHHDTLPVEVTALQSMLRTLQSELKIANLRCARLEYKMRNLLRRIYDAKSEKLNPAQRLKQRITHSVHQLLTRSELD